MAAKLHNRFSLFDRDGDGRVTKADYDGLARRLAEAAGEDADSPSARRLRARYDEAWARMSGHLGRGLDAELDEEEFVTTWFALSREVGFDEAILPIVDEVMTAMDSDRDERLLPDEFTRWIGAYGVSREAAAAVFTRLDRDGDGMISRDELVRAFREYHTGTDPELPGNWLYGPLPTY
ncbi:EF-hand domain-containing protein [Streptomyces sp. NPDC048606]|uniref:EF-hand domain-containing protein n=1 Tax=Streptomyces sp. NPDC048606 TaxID=3154726 RepID=UPI00342EF28B